MWHYEQMDTFTGILTVVIDIMCTRCVAHTHIYTHSTTVAEIKKDETLQNSHKQNWFTLLELQNTQPG